MLDGARTRIHPYMRQSPFNVAIHVPSSSPVVLQNISLMTIFLGQDRVQGQSIRKVIFVVNLQARMQSMRKIHTWPNQLLRFNTVNCSGKQLSSPNKITRFIFRQKEES